MAPESCSVAPSSNFTAIEETIVQCVRIPGSAPYKSSEAPDNSSVAPASRFVAPERSSVARDTKVLQTAVLWLKATARNSVPWCPFRGERLLRVADVAAMGQIYNNSFVFPFACMPA